MSTKTETLYTRPIPFDREVAQPGDRIDMAEGNPPYWQTLISVGTCKDDAEEVGDCDGECAFVLHLERGETGEDNCDLTWWHVPWDEFDDIKTSLPAVTR
jgi:hypothetical protein